MKFEKYSSAGNDFIVLNLLDSETESSKDQLLASHRVQQLCHRRFGIGADGIVTIERPSNKDCDFRFTIINSDGSLPKMCGNGLRAAVSFYSSLHRRPQQKEQCYRVETPHGEWQALLSSEGIGLISTLPVILESTVSSPWSGTWYDSGVPHFVKEEKNLAQMNGFQSTAKSIRNFSGFPEGTNVSFFEKRSDGSIFLRTFERGVEAETLACGTGVLAVAFHAFETGYPHHKRLALKTTGGEFFCELKQEQLILFGPTTHVFSGVLVDGRP